MSPTVIHVRFSGFDNSSSLWAPGGGGPPCLLLEKKLMGDVRTRGWGKVSSPHSNPPSPQLWDTTSQI